MTHSLIEFFDYFNTYFQLAFGLLALMCAAFCLWSVVRHFNSGILLLCILCAAAGVQVVLFYFAGTEQTKSSLPIAVREKAYLCGRLIGPPHAILFAVTAIVLGWENARRRKV